MSAPASEDLMAVAPAFAARFDEPAFPPGAWANPETRDDGVIILGWWSASETVVAWERALYDHHIIDPQSDYLGESNVALLNAAIADPSLLAQADLPTLRRALTFLARAERHTGGGWYESAFESGMAQAATRRLGELADETY